MVKMVVHLSSLAVPHKIVITLLICSPSFIFLELVISFALILDQLNCFCVLNWRLSTIRPTFYEESFLNVCTSSHLQRGFLCASSRTYPHQPPSYHDISAPFSSFYNPGTTALLTTPRRHYQIMIILKAVTGSVEKDTEIRNSLLFSVTLMAWLVLCHVRS